MQKIISLTSIPPRFKFLPATLDSLRAQNSCNEIRINIPRRYRRFPEWDGIVPNFGSKINLVRSEEDFGPATKILPTALDHQGEDTQILFCDDDGIHPKNWAKNLFDLQASRPHEAVATWSRCIDELTDIPKPADPIVTQQKIESDYRYRLERLLQKLIGYKPQWRPVRSAGYAHLLFGVGGVVVRPEFFDESALEIPEEAFLVDDIWLSAQLSLNGIKLYSPNRFPMPFDSDNSSVQSLLNLNVQKRRRELNIQAMTWCRENLGVWKTDIKNPPNAGQ